MRLTRIAIELGFPCLVLKPGAAPRLLNVISVYLLVPGPGGGPSTSSIPHLSVVHAAVSTASCDSLTSCSPSECTVSSDADCTFNTNVPDWSNVVSSQLQCKTCTVSTHNKCAAALPLAAARTSDAGSSIQAIYCNDEYLIVAASGLPPAYNPGQTGGDLYLKSTPLPPGGNTACRVRTAAAQLNVFKIPLNPTQVAAGQSNTIANPLNNVPGMPNAGAIAVAIDGIPMFPNYNNRGLFTWTSCEVDRCNAHSGKGEDYHYHGDPFGTKCLYTEADFTDATNGHPPLIGWSLDGYDVYGRYTKTTQLGQATALDACGGHEHGTTTGGGVTSITGYHYHPEVEQKTTSSLDGTNLNGATVTYTAYKLAPMECWKGNVGAIPNFWTSNNGQALYDSTKSANGLLSRADLEQLKPCCSMTTAQYFLRAGVTGFQGLTGGTSSSSSSSPTPSPSPTPTTTSSPTPTPTPAPSTSSTSSATTCTYGTCGSGNDNTGRRCPAQYGNGRPDCPPGCTAVPATGCSTTSSAGTSSPSPTPSAAAAPSPSPSPSPITVNSAAFRSTRGRTGHGVLWAWSLDSFWDRAVAVVNMMLVPMVFSKFFHGYLFLPSYCIA
ncbi:unnamed protein product [Amoebophrya sp. A120]|nr:unnamed protein product [Amoebophrya sp. A120]|eukprot:GSA120T00012412001.1